MAGGWRLAADGWRLAAGGWRLLADGWRRLVGRGMEAWAGFATAQVGAAAALAGLIFVGVSINLDRILKTPGVPARAGEALVALVLLVLASSLLLVPGLSVAAAGVGLLLLGLAGWLAMVVLQRRSHTDWEAARPRHFAGRVLLGQVASLPFAVAGATTLWRGEGGLRWLALGTLGVFLIAFVNAWVLLVEIDR